MKLLTIITIAATTLTLSCKSQEGILYGSQDVVKEGQKENDEQEKTVKDNNQEEQIETIQLQEVLGNKKWNQIINLQRVTIYKIDSVLIDTKVNEYGRTLKKIDTLNAIGIPAFIAEVTRLQNYPLLSESPKAFNPILQFEICGEDCELSLLLDSHNNKAGFINLDGQEVVSISEKMKNYLTAIPKI